MYSHRRTALPMLLVVALLALAALWHTTPVRASTMIFPRHGHTATRLTDGRVLVVGGSSSILAAEIYNPTTDTWSLTSTTQFPRIGHAAVRLADGRVLVFGGSYSSSDVAAEIYDPTTDRWSLTAATNYHFPYPSAALLPDGRVLVVGGIDQNYQIKNEIYDPATDTWAPVAPNPAGLYTNPTLMPLADGRVLLVGRGYGSVSDPIAVVETYTPALDKWTITSLGEPLREVQAVPLSNGRLLLMGIAPGSIFTPRAVIFDPASGQLTHATPPPMTFSDIPTTTLLPNGKVLFVGTACPGIWCELMTMTLAYDVATDHWLNMRPLAVRRANGTATLLDNGLVLFAGGTSLPYGQDVLNSAELYDTVTAALDKHIYLPLLGQQQITGWTCNPQPCFDATSTPPFGVTSTPPFDATSTPTPFGATSTPTPFGATSTPPFDATSTPTPFGATSTPTPFGATSTPTPFGATGTPTNLLTGFFLRP